MWLTVMVAMVCTPVVAVAQADIRATRCNACSELQFEQTAIGLGVGTQYLYDFAGGTLRAYWVRREPRNGGGGTVYEVGELGVDSVYQAIFDKAHIVYQNGGTLGRSMVLGLPGAPNTGGHSSDSVFGLFKAYQGGTVFGDWLGGYFSAQNIPVSAPQGTAELNAIMLANPTIEFTGDDKRLDVTITFKDGRAEFNLSNDEKRYKYVPGSARDSEGRPIPESLSQLSPYPYNFPGGPTSDAYLGFQSLMQFWGIPIGTAGWKCGTVVGGGTSSETCVLVR